MVSDSTFIRWHIEQKYRIDFDKSLDASQKAIAWAFEKMVEDQLYWVMSTIAGWTMPISAGGRRSSSSDSRR
jgi:hypothetical protein